MSDATAEDHELCHYLASGAAERLAALRHRLFDEGASHRQVELAGDDLAHQWLAAELAAHRPADAVLSEEGHDDRHRLSSRRTWIVDPLDGSSGFGWGSPEWAVHVALVIDGVGVAGAIGFDDFGTLSTGQPLPPLVTVRERPVVAVGRTRTRIDGNPMARHLEGETLVCSSAGVKAALVITGQADIYVHSGPLYEWDLCAPAVVAAKAGLDVVDPTGAPLRFNTSQAIVPGVVISHPDLTQNALDLLRDSGKGHRRHPTW